MRGSIKFSCMRSANATTSVSGVSHLTARWLDGLTDERQTVSKQLGSIFDNSCNWSLCKFNKCGLYYGNITAAQESDRIRIRDKLKLKIEKRRKTAKNGELGKYFVLCTNSAVYSKIYYKKSPDLIIPLYKNEVVCVILQLNPAATIWQFVEEFMTGLWL